MDTSMISGRVGESDPYVRVIAHTVDEEAEEADPDTEHPYIEEQERTDVMQNTCAPRWKQRFSFQWEGESARVVFDVYDADDLPPDDIIGTVTVTAEELSDRMPLRKWFPLLPDVGSNGTRSPDKPLGEVELVMRHVHNPARDSKTLATAGVSCVLVG